MAKKKAERTVNNVLATKLKQKSPRAGDHVYDISHSAQGVPSQVKYVLKTGLDPYDGLSGGLPFGRVVEKFGLESCGKTALGLLAMKQAQMGEIYERSREGSDHILKKVDRDKIEIGILYIDNEQSLDDSEALEIDGVPVDCIVSRCDTIDEVFKLMEDTIDVMEGVQAAEIAEAKKERRDPKECFTIVFVDTIAATSSAQEMDAKWDVEDYPRHAKKLSEGFRRLQRKINRNNVLILCTNQVREHFQAKKKAWAPAGIIPEPQASDYATFGGKALKFYASQRYFMYVIDDNYKISGSKFSQGLLVGFFTVKNRIAKPLRRGRLVLLFEGGYSNVYSKFETLKMLGLAEKKSGRAGRTALFLLSKVGLGAQSASAAADFDAALDGERDATDLVLTDFSALPAFWEQHKDVLDALWEKAVKFAFDKIDLESTEDADEIIDIP